MYIIYTYKNANKKMKKHIYIHISIWLEDTVLCIFAKKINKLSLNDQIVLQL